MKLIDKILIIETYHLTAGKEQDFLKAWKEQVYRVASGLGGRMLALYHKKNTNDYLISSYWSEIQLAEKYLASDELKRANAQLKKLCSAAYENEIFEVVEESAA